MGKFDWSKVTREDVEKAIKKFLEDTQHVKSPTVVELKLKF
jgi:hypothetical protein